MARSAKLSIRLLLLCCVACSTEKRGAAQDSPNAGGGSGGTSVAASSAASGGAAAPTAGRASTGGSAADTGGAGTAAIAGAAAGVAGPPSTAGGSGTQLASGGATATGGGGDSAATAGSAGDTTAHAGSGATAALVLIPVGDAMVSAQEFAFPSNALPPSNQSPEFMWTGVPAAAKSLALTFRDLTGGAVKWVVWDIPPTVVRLPPGIMPTASLSEVPGSSQLGSLGNQGYAGPCCTTNQYEFVLWALDVDKLPSTAGKSTVQLRDSLPAHALTSSQPVLMRIMP